MAIGLSTYAFFWRGASSASKPMSLEQMLEETAEPGGGVFQICDYPAVEQLSTARLAALSLRAAELGVALELGTRGLGRENLTRYLDIADRLDVRLVRSMLYSGDDRPARDEAVKRIAALLPRLEQQGVTLALETYEQVPLETLMAVVETLDHERVGVCLDPGNCVAALEMPGDVIKRTASRVVNLHLKDFAFRRSPGWVGFELTGAALGEGLLPLSSMMSRVAPHQRGINCVLEHWLSWQQDEATTHAMEARWTRHGMATFKERTW